MGYLLLFRLLDVHKTVEKQVSWRTENDDVSDFQIVKSSSCVTWKMAGNRHYIGDMRSYEAVRDSYGGVVR